MTSSYRGRIAPSPTGYLHLGHARTFWFAMERAKHADGVLIYREEDLDFQRCQKRFSDAARQDLAWFGIQWEEGVIKSVTSHPTNKANACRSISKLGNA